MLGLGLSWSLLGLQAKRTPTRGFDGDVTVQTAARETQAGDCCSRRRALFLTTGAARINSWGTRLLNHEDATRC